MKKGYATSTIRRGSGSRRAYGVSTSLAKRGYRPDLRPVSSSMQCSYNHLLFSTVLCLFVSLMKSVRRNFAPPLEPAGIIFERWHESWAWTCVQYRPSPSNGSRSNSRWGSRHVAIGSRSMPLAPRPDSLTLTFLSFPFLSCYSLLFSE